MVSDTDIVSVFALHLAATIGPDHWQRIRPKPITLSLHLHLAPSYLDTPGQSDNVTDSLHYGHLAKAIEQRVGVKGERGYQTVRALVDDTTDAAFKFATDAVGKGGDEAQEVIRAVRVVLDIQKQILLAGSFQVELTTSVSDWRSKATLSGAVVRVTALTLPVIIGVNPPERLAKQRVITGLTFYEADHVVTSNTEDIDYPTIVQQIAETIENSAYLTLEKLVYEIIQVAYRTSDANTSANVPRIDAITVRCQKPSALSFADASSIEMTRTREAVRLIGR